MITPSVSGKVFQVLAAKSETVSKALVMCQFVLHNILNPTELELNSLILLLLFLGLIHALNVKNT